MARGTITVYDIPPEVRAKGAAQSRQQLHTLLSNPHLTTTQRAELLDRLAWVAKWEEADVSEILPRPAPTVEQVPETQRAAQHHSVFIDDSLSVEET